MNSRVSIPAPDRAGSLSTAQADPNALADLVMPLMADLTEFERERFLQVLTERVQAIATPRAGKTLGAVVDFFKQERGRAEPVTIAEIREALFRNGVQVTPKEVYNAVGYLTRKKHLQRTGHAQYVIAVDQKEAT